MPPIKPITVTSSGGGDFTPAEPGVYLTRCYAVVDEGTHMDEVPANLKFQAKRQRSIRIFFEILQNDAGEDYRMENGKPFTLSKKYSATLGKRANLRKLLDSWRKTPLTEEEAASFVITDVIGKFCMAQIIHKQKTDGSLRADIGTVMSTSKKTEGVNEDFSFLVEDPNLEAFHLLPQWMQEYINESDEIKESKKFLPVMGKEEKIFTGSENVSNSGGDMETPPFADDASDIDNGGF